jgi:hypothetical protein
MNEERLKQRIAEKLENVGHRVLTSPLDGVIFTENEEFVVQTLFNGKNERQPTGWKTLTIRYFDPFTKDI